MSNYYHSKERAIQQYETAFHLLHATFPLIRDPKLLVGILHNIFNSLEAAMEAILRYERQLKLVPHYQENFQSRLNIFRYKSVQRNKIAPDYANLMIDLKEVLDLHKKSPVEFQRGNRFVICSKDYRLKTISLKDIKSYLDQNKEFLGIMEGIINNV